MNTPHTHIQKPELWQFPMDYPISIIGHEGEHDSLRHEVTLILAEIFPEFDHASIQVKPSKTGRFHFVFFERNHLAVSIVRKNFQCWVLGYIEGLGIISKFVIDQYF